MHWSQQTGQIRAYCHWQLHKQRKPHVATRIKKVRCSQTSFPVKSRSLLSPSDREISGIVLWEVQPRMVGLWCWLLSWGWTKVLSKVLSTLQSKWCTTRNKPQWKLYVSDIQDFYLLKPPRQISNLKMGEWIKKTGLKSSKWYHVNKTSLSISLSESPTWHAWQTQERALLNSTWNNENHYLLSAYYVSHAWIPYYTPKEERL